MSDTTETPTSSADEAESLGTAPSESSATQTPPDEEDLSTAMTRMSDFELVQVALVALAILHKRAAGVEDGSGQ